MNHRSNRGQSLFEVVVAIAMSALIITAIVSVASNSIQNSSFSRDKSVAATYVDQTTEWLRDQRDNDRTGFYNRFKPHGDINPATYCLKNLNWLTERDCTAAETIDGKFTRSGTFYVDDADVAGKDRIVYTITVTWTDSKGDHSAVGSSYLSPTPE